MKVKEYARNIEHEIYRANVEVYRFPEDSDQIYYFVNGFLSPSEFFIVNLFHDPVSALDYADALNKQISDEREGV